MNDGAETRDLLKTVGDKWAARTARAESKNAELTRRIEALIRLIDETLS